MPDFKGISKIGRKNIFVILRNCSQNANYCVVSTDIKQFKPHFDLKLDVI
jgi:hypothetical protein